MLANRIKTAIFIILIAVGFTVLGGWAFNIFIIALLALAGWEFWRLFSRGGYSPSLVLMIGGIIALTSSRALWDFEVSSTVATILILVAMVVHTVSCARGCKTPALDFAISMTGIFYLGWIGSYFIDLRSLSNGLWWILLVIPTIAIGDTGAYLIGSRFGRHLLAPLVSPKKTVEGYFGGLLFAILAGMLFAALWHACAPTITLLRGAITGAVLGLLTPLGDLGESMFKRQFQVKDTSNILGSHGGIFDRIDSWLWGAVIGYYLIVWFW